MACGGGSAAERWLLILVGSFVAEQARGVWASAVQLAGSVVVLVGP